MNNANRTLWGSIEKRGNTRQVDNALVEQVYTNNGQTGYMIVSYTSRGWNNKVNTGQLRLNVNRNIAIVNMMGRPVCLCDVKPGMWCDAEFSSAITRSIPPHTDAYRIVVRQKNTRPQQQRPSFPRQSDKREPVTTEGRVVSVDTANGMLTIGSPVNINRQSTFTISPQTRIYGDHGKYIPLRAIQPGHKVRVTHAAFQTMSIPPQSPAYTIQLL